MTREQNLSEFTGRGYDKGRGPLWQALWFASQHLLFGAWYFPARLRPSLLRAFGAEVGRGAHIRNGVRVHWPWKLSLGNNCWLGEGAWLLNLEPITIGNDVCISQEALVCTGSHDAEDPSFEFDNATIVIEDRAWIAARAIVLRGTTVPAGAVVRAAAVATPSRPTGSVV